MTRIRRRRSLGPRGLADLDVMQIADLRYGNGEHFADDVERRAAWREAATALMNLPGPPLTRPAGWWAYAPGIPARLRRLPAHPDPRPAFLPEPDLDAVIAYRDAKAARVAVQQGRRAFLASHDPIAALDLGAIRKPAAKSARTGPD